MHLDTPESKNLPANWENPGRIRGHNKNLPHKEA